MSNSSPHPVKYLLLFFMCSMCAVKVGAQPRMLVRGRVVDTLTREPIEAALITDLRSEGKTASGKNGDFALKAAPGDTLQVSFIGYRPQLIKAAYNREIFVAMEKGPIELKDVTINNGGPSFDSFHALTDFDLNLRPARSAQDLLRLVPGLFIAQHQGGGKAEQIFLRGFDADHGTDVNISVDGIPVNMVTHAHGQGYADLHFLIPETVSSYDFGKGPYYSDKGDFTTASYLNYTTKDALDKSMISIKGGQFNSLRVTGVIDLLGSKAKQNGENAYIAGEYNYTD